MSTVSRNELLAMLEEGEAGLEQAEKNISSISKMSKKTYTDAEKIAYWKGEAKKNKGKKAPAKKKAVYRKGGYGGRGKAVIYPNIVGYGDYKMNPEDSAGRRYGGLIGSKLGEYAGSAIHGLISSFTGMGDYQVIHNSLMPGGIMPPIINPHTTGGDVFRRSEYLGDLISSSSANSFKVQSFPINAGLEGTFQWLSQVAANYTQYQFEGMYFEFRSMSADALNSTNTALGQVIMCCNYNSSEPDFTNKQEMENHFAGISGKPSSGIRYFVECHPAVNVLSDLYIRQGAVPTGEDQRLFDLGNFQIATNGLQGTNVNLGEIYVTYQVCLRKPKLFSALGEYNSWASMVPSVLDFNNTNILNTNWSISPTSNIIGLGFTPTTIFWSPPSLPQTYNVFVRWRGTGAVPVVNPALTGSNGVTIRNFYISPPDGTTSSAATNTFQVTYKPSDNTSGGNPTITFGTVGVTLPTTPTAFVLQITQLPNTTYGV